MYSDVQRGEFQRQVLVELAKKVISWNSIPKVTSFLELFNTYVKTDLSMQDMLYFATKAMEVDVSTAITQATWRAGARAWSGDTNTALSSRRRTSCPPERAGQPLRPAADRGGSGSAQAEYYWNGTVID